MEATSEYLVEAIHLGVKVDQIQVLFLIEMWRISCISNNSNFSAVIRES